MSVATKTYACPECGAPLPVMTQPGRRVRCASCKTRVTVEDRAGAAADAEAGARRQAERFYAVVGAPPSLAQRAAVFFVNPLLWLLLFPFLIPMCRAVVFVPERIVDAALHTRLSHVWYPTGSWLLSVGVIAGAAIFLLLFSLYGLRTDARRSLQAALACAPPKVAGGPATCRICGAGLQIPAGARGVRCNYCRADNLVSLPESWVGRARDVERTLKVSVGDARRLWAEGRRNVRRGAWWRVPVALVIAGLALWPMRHLRGAATWKDLLGTPTFRLAMQGNSPIIDRNHAILRIVPRCDAEVSMRVADKPGKNGPEWLDVGPAEGALCQRHEVGCLGVVALPMRRGETLRLLWRSPPLTTTVRWALADRHPNLRNFVLPLFGDELAEVQLQAGAPGSVAAELPAHTTGFHVLSLSAPPDTRLLMCVLAN